MQLFLSGTRLRQHSVLEELSLRSSLNILNNIQAEFLVLLIVMFIL